MPIDNRNNPSPMPAVARASGDIEAWVIVDPGEATDLSAGEIITDERKRQAIVDGWYRDQVKKAVPELIAKWEPVLGVKVRRSFIRRMKTKWGSCNPGACSIRLNTELAKKPLECLEYIVVHEMVRLLERGHGERLATLVDRCMPDRRARRERLNDAPLAHEH